MSEKVFEIVTKAMIEKLEAGVVPWHRPWDAKQGLQRNGKTQRPYSGFNQFSLSLMGYRSPEWFTMKQLGEMRQYVLTGQKGTPVVFSSRNYNVGDDGKREYYGKWFFRFYSVWNAEQTTIGYIAPEGEETHVFPEYDAIYENYPNAPTLGNGTSKAFYNPSSDNVAMPHQTAFESVEHYYSVLYHELIHSTGHPKRLSRFEPGKDSFGSEPYSFEELVAEMGACYLASYVGITDEAVFDNSAAYVSGWLNRLKDDKGLVIRAGNAAAKAFAHIVQEESEE